MTKQSKEQELEEPIDEPIITTYKDERPGWCAICPEQMKEIRDLLIKEILKHSQEMFICDDVTVKEVLKKGITLEGIEAVPVDIINKIGEGK
jgi:hypothetical protein